MKKNFITYSIGMLFSIPSYALTEQINFSNSYIVKEKIPLSYQEKNLTKKQISILDELLGNYIEIKKDINPGTKNNNLIYLVKHLNELGENDIYDQSLIRFIKEKQKENKLNQTGVIDPVTWFSIYEQPKAWKEEILSKAKVNWNNILEKHKVHKNNQMIIINIPSMTLSLYEKDLNQNYNLLLESKVVVGRTKTQTPIKDFEVISIKYNPTWTPTKNILKRNLYDEKGEINVKWLEEHGLKIYDESGNQRDYSEISTVQNPKFMQDSGGDNALGFLKFETTSKDDIYLHDTNERYLFGYNTRTYSSGCIRVQQYMDLASILAGKPKEKIQETIDNKETVFRPIKKIPVYIDYSQVKFKEEGTPVFYPDIYSKNR